MKATIKWSGIALLVAAVFLFTACGNTGDSGDSGNTGDSGNPGISRDPSGLEFTLFSGSMAYGVSRGRATAADIVIPSTHNGLPISVIMTNGFEGYTAMTSITIPDSVKYIYASAFKGCNGLASITIINSVLSIHDSAFEGCSILESVTIPDSVINIWEDAFKGCDGLESITIPFVGGSEDPKYCRSVFGYIFGYMTLDDICPKILLKSI
jgi:hypothetical protein